MSVQLGREAVRSSNNEAAACYDYQHCGLVGKGLGVVVRRLGVHFIVIYIPCHKHRTASDERETMVRAKFRDTGRILRLRLSHSRRSVEPSQIRKSQYIISECRRSLSVMMVTTCSER